jgi:hypothetical protein
MPEHRTTGADLSAREDIDLQGLMRLAAWGAAAAAALMLAVFATRSELGTRRMAAVFGTDPQSARLQSVPSPVAARTAELEFETRQMAAALRSLSADRDRLLARVTILERSVDDVVTGSIPRAAAKPDTPAADAAAAPAARPVVVGPSLIATMSSPLTIPSPSPEALARIGLPSLPSIDEENIATRTEFGVDIGNGPNLAALRNAWSVIRRNHGDLFEGLYPIIAIRDGTRPGAVDLRLIIGPLNNAAAAARLCGKVANAGLSCQPAIFDGQRLALR